MGVEKKSASDRNAERREMAERLSSPSITCKPIIVIRNSGKPDSEPIQKKVPKRYLDQALDNAIVLGDFERVKRLVEEEGAIPLGKHVKTAMNVKEEKIEKYLEEKIAERRGNIKISRPSDEGWEL